MKSYSLLYHLTIAKMTTFALPHEHERVYRRVRPDVRCALNHFF